MKEIPLEVYYSIGCIYSSRELWLNLPTTVYQFDELLIHHQCLRNGQRKWAVMSEPFLHLFYHNQRIANRALLLPIAERLADFFDDEKMKMIAKGTLEDRLILLEELSKGNFKILTAIVKALQECE